MRLAAHGEHSCAIKTDGTLWCWGSNFVGELGDNRSFSATPVPVSL